MNEELDKILFLDFDGPLTNTRSFMAYDAPAGRMMWTTADPVMIQFLNTLWKRHNFKTVVSSTWRIGAEINPTKLDAKETLRHWGFEGEFHKDWSTPYRSSGHRSEEIREWLTDHQNEVYCWASLDDVAMPKWVNNVQAHPNNGITDFKQMEQLHNFLSGGAWTMEMAKEKNII